MIKNVVPDSLYAKVETYVNGRESSTIGQVVGAVGRYIPATEAMKRSRLRGKNRKVNPNVDHGKHMILAEVLSVLFRLGKIRRISKGIYGPKLPTVFQEPRTA